MNEQAVVDIQSAMPGALKHLEAKNLETAVRTKNLAKRIKLQGVREDPQNIAVALTELATTEWGRKHATFVGGTRDPNDQYIWHLPKE